jgi:hypothetical protein
MQRAFGFIVCFLFASAVVQAQEAGQDPRVGEAKTACVGGDLQKGIRLLAELYTASGDPIWLFNQGRCFQQNDQLPQALSRFKEFLRKSQGAPGEDVADARKYIAELDAELQKAQPASKSPSTPSVEPSVAVSTTAGPVAPETRPGRGLRYAGLGSIIAGGVFLATGVVFSVMVNKTSKDIESQTNQVNGVDWSAVSGKYSDGSRYKTWQWVFYGVGAAAALAGSALYWMGTTSTEPRVSATHVFPVVVANGAGAGLHMAF